MMIDYVRSTVHILEGDALPLEVWGRCFVKLRREFWFTFNPDKLIFSTAHGADFFRNLLDCLEGRREWTKDDERGELGDNFRRLVEQGRKEIEKRC